MSSDWIRMRRGLRSNPKVVAMARHLSHNPEFLRWMAAETRGVTPNVTPDVTASVTLQLVTRVTLAALHDVWSALNNSIDSDGVAPTMILEDLDLIGDLPGLGEAMESVGWVVDNGAQGLEFPNFAEHNTPSNARAKKAPKSSAERVREHRARQRANKVNEPVTNVTNVTTEKRREEKSTERERGAGAGGEDGGRRAGELPTVEAALEHAAKQWPGVDPDLVREWWAVRSRDDWRKATGSPLRPNQRMNDLEAWVMHKRQQAPPARGRGASADRRQREVPTDVTPEKLKAL